MAGKNGGKKDAVKVLVLAVIFGLMIFSGLSTIFLSSSNPAVSSYLNSEGNGVSPPTTSTVPCLTPGVPIRQDFDLHLAINIGGRAENIPDGIGINSVCKSEIATIDGNGHINVKAQDDRQYTLGDFFAVWGRSFYLPGYVVKMTVNGKQSNDLENLVLQKNQLISLIYASSTSQ